MAGSNQRDEVGQEGPQEHAPRSDSSAGAGVAEASGREVRGAPSAPRNELESWHVILHDDDDHTYEYVMAMMQQLFGHPLEQGFTIAKAVDEDGRAICMTTHKELAELKRDQIHAYGRDPLMARSKGSMRATIEKAPA